MSVIEHWWCSFCGAFDGPIGTGGECEACADQHDPEDPEHVEPLVPQQQLRGGVEALRQIVAHDPPMGFVRQRQIAQEALEALGVDPTNQRGQ